MNVPEKAIEEMRNAANKNYGEMLELFEEIRRFDESESPQQRGFCYRQLIQLAAQQMAIEIDLLSWRDR